MIKFTKADYQEIESLRNEYLDNIYEAQELYLELIVKKADYYIIKDEETIGYFIISPENILVEFHLTQSNIKECEWIFREIIHSFNVKKIYCKSFDSILLKCSLKHTTSHKVIGTLFRDFTETKPDEMSEFQIRLAAEDDIPHLLQQKDELYESEEELFEMVKSRNIIMYYLNDQLIGCGYLIRTINSKDFYDIGMWVKSEYRQRGFATRIIANLKHYCLKNNLIPTCGCDVNNLPSRKALEKNGFISRHDLIEFKVT